MHIEKYSEKEKRIMILNNLNNHSSDSYVSRCPFCDSISLLPLHKPAKGFHYCRGCKKVWFDISNNSYCYRLLAGGNNNNFLSAFIILLSDYRKLKKEEPNNGEMPTL